MSIQKLNGAYVADQDRVLLRISTSEQEEIRLWLTRKTCLSFLDKTKEISLKSIENDAKNPLIAAKMIDEFNQQNLRGQLDFKAPFEPKAKLPLGHEPVLIKSIEVAPYSSTEGALMVSFVLDHGQILRDLQNRTKVNALRLLFEQLMTQANWGDTSQDKALAINPPKPSIH